jgi:hypothetical protein
MKERMPHNQFNHMRNLSSEVGLHGQFYHGIYYDHGHPQISKEKHAKMCAKLARRATICELPQLEGFLDNGIVTVVYSRRR